MDLSEQQPKLRSWGLRPALLKLHRDLLIIHDHVNVIAAYYPKGISNLEIMTMVLEDRRFMYHYGFDLSAMAREATKALLLRKHGGASTIDMQFVRTATGYKERSAARKIYEIILSVIIQYRYSKVVILRSYLSCAFFGSQLIGAERASQEIFGLPPDLLDVDQAAELASMLVYPRPKLGGEIWSKKVSRRAKYGVAVYVSNKDRFNKIKTGK